MDSRLREAFEVETGRRRGVFLFLTRSNDELVGAGGRRRLAVCGNPQALL
jgi:hypothetical protein